MQPFGRERETLLVRHRHEVVKLPQLHLKSVPGNHRVRAMAPGDRNRALGIPVFLNVAPCGHTCSLRYETAGMRRREGHAAPAPGTPSAAWGPMRPYSEYQEYRLTSPDDRKRAREGA